MENLSKKIRVARENLQMTQEELGRLCGTTKQTIFKYENGIITNIPMDRLEKIAVVLHVSPAYLMGWELDTSRPTKATLSLDSALHLSSLEKEIVLAYRKADDLDQRLVLRTLKIDISEEKSSSVDVG